MLSIREDAIFPRCWSHRCEFHHDTSTSWYLVHLKYIQHISAINRNCVIQSWQQTFLKFFCKVPSILIKDYWASSHNKNLTNFTANKRLHSSLIITEFNRSNQSIGRLQWTDHCFTHLQVRISVCISMLSAGRKVSNWSVYWMIIIILID